MRMIGERGSKNRRSPERCAEIAPLTKRKRVEIAWQVPHPSLVLLMSLTWYFPRFAPRVTRNYFTFVTPAFSRLLERAKWRLNTCCHEARGHEKLALNANSSLSAGILETVRPLVQAPVRSNEEPTP